MQRRNTIILVGLLIFLFSLVLVVHADPPPIANEKLPTTPDLGGSTGGSTGSIPDGDVNTTLDPKDDKVNVTNSDDDPIDDELTQQLLKLLGEDRTFLR